MYRYKAKSNLEAKQIFNGKTAASTKLHRRCLSFGSLADCRFRNSRLSCYAQWEIKTVEVYIPISKYRIKLNVVKHFRKKLLMDNLLCFVIYV